MSRFSQQNMGSRIQVGDRVMYSRRFLRSIGVYSGDMPFAEATVTRVAQLSLTLRIVTAESSDGQIMKALDSNLIRATDAAMESTF